MSPSATRFTQLWLRAQPVVAAYLSASIHDPHTVDDLLQETASALYERFDDYQTDRPFTPWAMGFARNLALNWYRRQGREGTRSINMDFLDDLATACEEIDEELSAERLAMRDCLQGVQGTAWEVLQRRYESNQNASEIASAMQLTASNVRSILKRVRDALAKCISKRIVGLKA